MTMALWRVGNFSVGVDGMGALRTGFECPVLGKRWVAE